MILLYYFGIKKLMNLSLQLNMTAIKTFKITLKWFNDHLYTTNTINHINIWNIEKGEIIYKFIGHSI